MRESLPALSFCRRGIMEKILRLNLAILFLLFAMMLVSPSVASLKNPVGSTTVEAKSKKKPGKEKQLQESRLQEPLYYYEEKREIMGRSKYSRNASLKLKIGKVVILK